MNNHLAFSDHEFEQSFAAGTFPAALFSHEAHIRLAWIHIKKYGLSDAINNISRQLKAFVILVDAEDKYNETVTVAAVKAVHHFMLKSDAADFRNFIADCQPLLTRFNALLQSHYKTNIFTDEKAKYQFLEPELAPFD